MRAFLEHAQRLSCHDVWPQTERLESSELAGLCTFSNASDVLEYGANSVLGFAQRELYIVLTGREVGRCAEEGSVMLADSSIVSGPMTRLQFMSVYCQ